MLLMLRLARKRSSSFHPTIQGGVLKFGVDRNMDAEKVHSMMRHEDIPETALIEMYGRGGVAADPISLAETLVLSVLPHATCGHRSQTDPIWNCSV